MEKWKDKNFRLLEPIWMAFESLMSRKGDQMYAASAALLWYVRSDTETRLRYESKVRRIEKGLGTVEEPGYSEEEMREALQPWYALLEKLDRMISERGWVIEGDSAKTVIKPASPEQEDEKKSAAHESGTAEEGHRIVQRSIARAHQQEQEETPQKDRRRKAP